MAFVSVTRQYSFEAGHWLPKVPEGHKCRRPHGHNYVVEVSVNAEGGYKLDPAGFVIDFWDLDKVVQPLIDKVDHQMLNEISGLDNPTAELIATWFLVQLPTVSAVRVYETERCWADATR